MLVLYVKFILFKNFFNTNNNLIDESINRKAKGDICWK